MSHDIITSVALTVDLDPDANRPVPGRPDAVSPSGQAAFCACFEGLEHLASLLEDRGIPATLFWEARTLRRLADCKAQLLGRLTDLPRVEHGCHGLQHEDFAGERTGLPFSRADAQALLQSAGSVFRSVLGRSPRGFRAPYCRLTPGLSLALVATGYHYDASRTHDLERECALEPYRLESGDLWELPLCRGRDARGRAISAYLWQLCEGNRTWQDYAGLLEAARRRCPGGLVQFALHPWHLVVNAEGEPHNSARRRTIAEELAHLLDRIAAQRHLRLTTPGEYLAAG